MKQHDPTTRVSSPSTTTTVTQPASADSGAQTLLASLEQEIRAGVRYLAQQDAAAARAAHMED